MRINHIKHLQLLLIVTLTAVILILPVCADEDGGVSEKRIIVAVSVVPQSYFVEQIGGDRVETAVMIPPGTSPAVHEPTMEQMRQVAKAAIYVKVGHPRFPFEKAWLSNILKNAGEIVMVDSSNGVEVKDKDPHIWTSPSAAKKQVSSICEALERVDAEHGDFYRRNRDEFLDEIERLERDIRAILKGAKTKKFMVFHPAWGYFADYFGLEQIAIEREGKEPGAAGLKHFIELAEKEDIKVIMVQPQFDRKDAEVIAKAVSAELITVDPLSKDWPGSLRKVAEAIAKN